MPTFVTVHTFCASQDNRISYGWCLNLINTGRDISVRFKTMRKKQNLASALQLVFKKKIGGNHAFVRDNKASI